MDKMYIVYIHLLAMSMAIGVILTTDLRLMVKFLRYGCVIRPPTKFESRVISIALITLIASGAALIALDTTGKALQNPKILAKIGLVAMLCVNSLVLHLYTFPKLLRAGPVSTWTFGDKLGVALPVSLSNSLWLYCAFLGVARPWNHIRPLEEVLLPAGVMFVTMAIAILLALRVAARDQPKTPPDWLDSMKAKLSDHAPLGSYKHSFEDTAV